METTTDISNHSVENSPCRSKDDRAAGGDHNIDQLQKVEESTLKEIDDDKVVETDEATQTAKSSTSEEGALLMQHVKTSTPGDDDESGRERLKRHRMEMAGRVWIPDTWGQEDLLKDWIDCSVFDASLVKNSTILSARATLMQQTTTHAANSASLRRRIENRC